MAAQPSAIAALTSSVSTLTVKPITSSGVQGAWERAVQAHLEKLTPEQRSIMSQKTGPEQLAQSLKDLHAKGKSKKTTKLLDFLHRFTTPLQEFQAAIDVVVQMNAGIGSPIWAPMKLVLIVLQKHNDFVDRITEQMTKFCAALPRYEQYSKIFESSELVQKSLGDLYLDYLDFCVRIAKQLTKNGFAILARFVARSVDAQFKEILSSMELHRNEVEHYAGLASKETVEKIREQQREDSVEKLTDKERSQREKVLKWLSPSIFDAETDEFERSRMPGTCQWILQNGKFTDWKNDSNQQGKAKLLWVSGNAGCGKSFLADFARRNLMAYRPCPVLFFFFDSKQENSQKRSVLSFLRTLLYQVLIGLDGLAPSRASIQLLYPLMESSGNNVASSPNVLWSAAEKIFSQVPPMFLVTDALDECEHSERAQLLERLVSLARITQSLKILITSRPELDILDRFEGLGTEIRLRFSNEDVNEDVKTYVYKRLNASKTLNNPSVRAAIETRLEKNVDGMFLYARLVIDELENETTARDVQKKLDDLPKTLLEYYEAALEAIKNTSESRYFLARDIFLWVLAAKRPLRVDELNCAISAQRRIKSTNAGDEFDSELLSPEEQLRKACFPLIEILENGIVRVIHTSVAQYLLGEGFNGNTTVGKAVELFKLDLSWAHHQVTLTSVNYLISEFNKKEKLSALSNEEIEGSDEKDTRASLSTSTETESMSISESDYFQEIESMSISESVSYSFLNYCGLYWDQHALEAIRYLDDHQQALIQLCEEETNRSKFFKLRRDLNPAFRAFFSQVDVVTISLLHIAAYFNLYELVSCLLNQKYPVDVNAQDSKGQTPFHVATERGNNSLMQLLLAAGADVNAADNDGVTALHVTATRDGNGSAAKLLLAAGADVNAMNSEEWTPLHVAARVGDGSTAKLLLEAGADVNAVDSDGWTALHKALQFGHDSIAKLLLEAGADVNAVDSDGQTALHKAAYNTDDSTAKLLLAAGADVNAMDSDGRTALDKAADYGKDSTAKLLLAAGADVNAVGSN